MATRFLADIYTHILIFDIIDKVDIYNIVLAPTKIQKLQEYISI